MGEIRDLFKKIRDTKGTFHAKMSTIKDRNGMDLTEAEDIKKKWHPGADCGTDHELLIAKFRLKLKKAGTTTRPFRYDLNQIPYDYTVEVRNRFKGLDLLDKMPDELWREVRVTRVWPQVASHSSTLAWKIPWTVEPCRLQSLGSQRVGHG